MHVESFDSTEEMVAALRERAAHALAGLAPAQQAITYGDYWVQFHDLDNRHLVFGRVHTREEIAFAELHFDTKWPEIVQVIEQGDISLAEGRMYGRAHDRFNVEGDLGTTHKAHVWPIEERLFDAAAAAEFDIAKMTDPAMRLLLEVAFRSMKAHVRSQHPSVQQ